MLFYFCILISPFIWRFFFWDLKSEKNKKRYLFCVFTVLILVASLRNASVGVDTENYMSTYKLIRDYGFNAYTRVGGSIEYGYVAVVWLLSRFFNSPQAIVIFFSLVTNIMIAKTIYRYSNDIMMSSFLYILWLFPSSMNGMRQHFAGAILLMMIPFLTEKKPLKAAIIVLIAFLFHGSSIMFLPFVFLAFVSDFKNKEGMFRIAVFCGISVISVFSLVDKILEIIVRIVPRYASYLKLSMYAGSESKSTLWIVIYSLFIVAYFIILKSENKNDSVYLECLYGKKYSNNDDIAMLFFAMLLLLQIESLLLAASVSRMFSRLNIYFKLGAFFVFPYVINRFFVSTVFKIYNYRVFFLIKATFYVLFIVWGVSMIAQDGHQIIPYIFCWE